MPPDGQHRDLTAPDSVGSRPPPAGERAARADSAGGEMI